MKDHLLNGILIPARMRDRPRFLGMPIPYTTWVHPETGVPDFKINDEKHRVRCIEKRLCSLCGEKMNRQVVFIGGPGSIEHGQLFMDAGMHPGCAQFAWDVCPYIVLGKGHAKTRKTDPRAVVKVFAAIPTGPPERMGMLTTSTYVKVYQGGELLVKAGPREAVVWRTYERSAP